MYALLIPNQFKLSLATLRFKSENLYICSPFLDYIAVFLSIGVSDMCRAAMCWWAWLNLAPSGRG